MREIEILGQAIREAFGGSAQGAADAIELLVVGRGEVTALQPYYIPPNSSHCRGLVLLPGGISAVERDLLLIRALGHHFLRHRERRVYRLDLPDAEVDRFAEAFLDGSTTATAVPDGRRGALRAIAR